MAPKLAFSPGGELYAAVMQAPDATAFDGSVSTLTVFKYGGGTSWAPLGDPLFVQRLYGMPTLSQPALAVDPATGEPWVTFLRNQGDGSSSKLTLMRYVTPPQPAG